MPLGPKWCVAPQGFFDELGTDPRTRHSWELRHPKRMVMQRGPLPCPGVGGVSLSARVEVDVPNDVLELLAVPHKFRIRELLPERLAWKVLARVGPKLRCQSTLMHCWTRTPHQKVDMVRHEHGCEAIVCKPGSKPPPKGDCLIARPKRCEASVSPSNQVIPLIPHGEPHGKCGAADCGGMTGFGTGFESVRPKSARLRGVESASLWGWAGRLRAFWRGSWAWAGGSGARVAVSTPLSREHSRGPSGLP